MPHASPGAATAPMVRLLALVAAGLTLAGAGDPDSPASRGIRIDPPAAGPLAPPPDPGAGSPPPIDTAPPPPSTSAPTMSAPKSPPPAAAAPPPAAAAPPPPAAAAPPAPPPPVASAPPPPAAAPLTPAPQPAPPPPPTAAAPPAPPPPSAAPGNAPAPSYAAPQSPPPSYAPPQQPPPSYAAPQQPPPPYAAPQSPPPSAGEPAPPELQFTALVQAFTFVRDSAAYVAARLDAPQMYPLRAGTSVMSAARSTDGRWIIALTEDGRAAYLPADDLGPYDPNRAPGPEQPPVVSGEAQVVDTATLIVNGQRLALAGVEGEGGEYARQLQSLIASQGGRVSCAPQGRGFVCQLANGMDIARAALYNGAARAADDASEDYRQQAESARSGRRGIWR
jgi:hypothetical protein